MRDVIHLLNIVYFQENERGQIKSNKECRFITSLFSTV